MRIALLSPLFESVPPRRYGGTERVVDALCRGLTARGHDVTLFASGDSRTAGRLVPVIDESLRLRPVPVTDPIAYNFRMLAEVARRAHEFDVIHNHHDYWMLPLARMMRTPLLTTLHGQLDLPDIAHAFEPFSDTAFVSISDRQRAPMPWLNWARTIHHGMDFSGLELKREPGKYLAFLGRIDSHKRPEYAIEIARRAGVPLKIAAKIEGRAAQDYYDTHVKPFVDGRNIEYVGEITDGEKSEFLGNALALAFPIDWPEPFGLVMIESLACGTPVLARPFGSVSEVLQDGVTGFVDADLGALARRVTDLGSISREGCRAYVEQRFSISRMIEEYTHVYRRLSESALPRTQPTRKFRTDRHRRNFLHPVERLAHGNT